MFPNEIKRHNTHKDKSKKSKTQKLCNISSIAECSKSKKTTKLKKNYKHSKLKHATALSDYVGADRLTKHITFFSKGKISESISRLQKTMPNEIRARAEQDLQKVLSSANNVRNKEYKHKEKYISRHKSSFKERSIRSSLKTPQYLYHKTGFASTSWKDKLQKSVGVTVCNSILASVNEQPQKTSIEKELLVIQKTLLGKIHPCITEANSLLFPHVSNKDKIKQQLLQISNRVNVIPAVPSRTASVCSNVSISPYFPLKGEIISSSQSDKNEDFYLNPIFTGEDVDRDITQIFPHVGDSDQSDDDSITSDINYSSLSNNTYNNTTRHSQVSSNSVLDQSGSISFIPSSPVSSDGSPAWKLRLSPVKFLPEQPPTPIIYFRHKMF